VTEVDLRVLDDPAAAAAELLADAARSGARIALSGGSTVGPAFERAAELAPDWSRAEIYWGDERAVPPGDERSNFGLAKASLLDRLAAAPRAVHRIEGERGAEAAADAYDELLRGVELDLALNGIGPDGHTASLFPSSPGLDAADRRAVAAEPGLEPFVPRVTLTPSVFASAATLVFLVAGEGKAEAVRRAFAEPPTEAVPASLVRGRSTVALLDGAAASRLPSFTNS
jgi:6-phosphogluconolactonase